MLLAIDCGNTNTVFAIYNGEKELGIWRISTDPERTSDEYAVWLTQLMSLKNFHVEMVKEVIIATVVPRTRFNLNKLINDHFKLTPLIVRDPDVKLGIKILVERPEQVGSDRLVTAVGAHARYPEDLIVIDFGTGTTFDIIDKNGNWCGGVISPGVNLSVEALSMAGALLPRVNIEKPKNIIGGNTVAAMQSGIFWGYISMIEGMVPRIVEEYRLPMKVIATGGLASLFVDHTDIIEVAEPDLTLFVLVEINRRNRI